MNPSDGGTLAGTAEAGATVRIDLNGDGTPDATVAVDATGHWTYTPATALPDDTTVTVTAVDAAGNVSAAATITTDNGAGAAPAIGVVTDDAALGEAESKARSLEADAARLEAEINGGEPRFSAAVKATPGLVAREMELMRSRRENLAVATASLRESLALTQRQLTMTEPLVQLGAANQVEVIQLKRQANEIQAKLDSVRNQYVIDASADYAKARADLDQVTQVVGGRQDQLDRTVLTSPVRGIVKNLEVTRSAACCSPAAR